MVPAEALKHRSAHPELESDLFHGEVEVLGEELEIDVGSLTNRRGSRR